MNAVSTAEIKSSKSLPDDHHYHLKSGDTDPELNKEVREIVLCTEHFIVYLADDLSIQWRTSDTHPGTEKCGEVLNRVAVLEGQSAFIETQTTLASIRRQIAEALARCLDDHPKEESLTVLSEVEQQISARNKEVAWGWYFMAAYIVTGVCVLLFMVLWLFRSYVGSIVGTTALEVIFGMLCGSLGALLSATTRADRLVMDANAGKSLLRLEGLSRIGAGLIGAIFVALSLKSGMILGGIQFSGNPLALLLSLCIAAGASERLVPSLVETFEKTVRSGERSI